MYRGTFLVLWTMSKDIYLQKKVENKNWQTALETEFNKPENQEIKKDYEKIKENTWYTMKNGEIVEAKEN